MSLYVISLNLFNIIGTLIPTYMQIFVYYPIYVVPLRVTPIYSPPDLTIFIFIATVMQICVGAR